MSSGPCPDTIFLVIVFIIYFKKFQFFRKTNISFSHCLDTNIVLQSCGGASVEVEHRNTKVPGYKELKMIFSRIFLVASILNNL